MKCVIADPKAGKCYQIEIDENKSKPFYKEKIGSKINGSLVGLTGYDLEVTGGSDKQGFPMRKDVHGGSRKRLLLSGGTGFRQKKAGERRKKTVCGNKISENIVQLNLKVTKFGEQSVAKLLNKEEKKTEEPVKKEEKPKVEKKEEVKKEEPKVEEKKEEPKPETKKEEPKVEEKKPEPVKEEVKPEEAPKEEEPKKESINISTEKVLKEIKEEKQ